MEFKIFDVKHGFCAALMDTNYLTLIDCGHDALSDFRPLQWLYDKGYRHIDALIISNFDQDHISDIKAIRDYFTVEALAVNPTVSPAALRNIKIKGGSISSQMEVLINSIEHSNLMGIDYVNHQTPRATFDFYCVYYPHETETNNLSLVTFITFGTSKIIIPGDLEESGWLKLLRCPDFLEHLRSTNVFVASHHGRINGYCKDVFGYCHPEVVLVSDKERTFSTQDHDSYSRHVRGVNMGSLLLPNIRKVLTTRNDGHITLRENMGVTYVNFGL